MKIYSAQSHDNLGITWVLVVRHSKNGPILVEMMFPQAGKITVIKDKPQVDDALNINNLQTGASYLYSY